jgi:vacuolar-type H+-ATPase subunit I/STV1
MDLSALLGWAASTLMPIVTAVLVAFLSKRIADKDDETKEYRKLREEAERQQREADDARRAKEHNALVSLMREQLLKNYENCMAKGFYSHEERDVYADLYQAYHDLGGNGTMAQLKEKIVELPTFKKEEK